MKQSLFDRFLAAVTGKTPPPAADVLPPVPKTDIPITTAAGQVEQALEELLEAMRDLSRRDPKVMALLQNKYGVPQRMTKLADSLSAFITAIEPIIRP